MTLQWRRISATAMISMTAVMMACGHRSDLSTAALVIACAQDAMAAPGILSNATDMDVSIQTTPSRPNTTGRPASRRISFHFPDRYESTTDMHDRNGALILSETRGFRGARASVSVSDGNAERQLEISPDALQEFRTEFARSSFMWFLRQSPLTPLQISLREPGTGRAAVLDVAGAGLRLQLIVDSETCLPSRAEYDRAISFGDTLGGGAGSSGVSGVARERFEFGPYEKRGGLRFPTRFLLSTNGVPQETWVVTHVHVHSLSQDLDWK